MAASSLQFESVCEDDSDKVGFEPLVDLCKKKIDYSLLISMRESRFGLRPWELSRAKSRANNLIVSTDNDSCFGKSTNIKTNEVRLRHIFHQFSTRRFRGNNIAGEISYVDF